ncbi:MAG: hypothetical protein KME25_34370 [Symplocastrum torsivum CPER-KK1]|jgi:hypothetical protein|uniref:Uncharacterized protein n=1 Tax=Symplocastrum torsivum CPER-KK1 TaxID=450513 RepID=A0A951UDT3_9CYAN|nr:hypothetical protein [Symplocastrum torsivum CPER-KK1]
MRAIAFYQPLKNAIAVVPADSLVDDISHRTFGLATTEFGVLENDLKHLKPL